MTTAAIGALVVLLALSFATAVVPIGPPEALVLAMTLPGATSPQWAISVAVIAACGQAAGKLVVFLSVRGSIRCKPAARLMRNPLVQKLAQHDQAHPRHLPALVAVSAFASIPPFVVVSPFAGSTAMRPHVFLVYGLAGRLARFSLLALGLTALL